MSYMLRRHGGRLAWRRVRAGLYVSGNSTDPVSYVIERGNGYGPDRLATKWYLTIRTCDDTGAKREVGGFGSRQYDTRALAELAAEESRPGEHVLPRLRGH